MLRSLIEVNEDQDHPQAISPLPKTLEISYISAISAIKREVGRKNIGIAGIDLLLTGRLGYQRAIDRGSFSHRFGKQVEAFG